MLNIIVAGATLKNLYIMHKQNFFLFLSAVSEYIKALEKDDHEGVAESVSKDLAEAEPLNSL